MRLLKIILCVTLLSVLINWIRMGDDTPIQQALPFLGGHPVGVHDVGAAAMLIISLWGLARLRPDRRNQNRRQWHDDDFDDDTSE